VVGWRFLERKPLLTLLVAHCAHSLPPAAVTHRRPLPAVALVVSNGTCWESKAEEAAYLFCHPPPTFAAGLQLTPTTPVNYSKNYQRAQKEGALE
jgi:hypothetical protein